MSASVHFLEVDDRDDGWILVRKAECEHEAWVAARDELSAFYGDGQRRDPRLVRAGSFRWNPCNEHSCWDGGGHRVHLGFAHGESGSWQGWLFR